MRRIFLALVCLLLWAQPAAAAIAAAGTGKGDQTNPAGTTIDDNISALTVGGGSDRVLFALLYVNANADANAACTWNSASPDSTLFEGQVDASGRYIAIFVWLAPATGDQVFACSWTGGARAGVVLRAYTGVDQTTPADGLVDLYTNGSSDSSSLDVSSASGDLVIDIIGVNNDAGVIIGASQVNEVQEDFGGGTVASSEEAGGATVTMSWSGVAFEVASHSAFNINAAAGGGSVTLRGMLLGVLP